VKLLGDIHAAQLAGIWDCDGNIGIARRYDKRYEGRAYYRPVVQIGQVPRALLDWVVDVIGDGRVYKHGRRPVHFLRLPERVVVEFLERIRPYLILKRRQAELAIELSRSQAWNGKKIPPEVIARREAIWAEARALNRKRDGAEYLPPVRPRLRVVHQEVS